MKLSLWAAGIGMTLTIFLAALLPRERSAELTREFPVPPADLYRVVRDVAAQPSWRTGVRVTDVSSDGTEWSEESDEVRYHFRIVRAVEGQALEVAFDSPAGVAGAWAGRFEPTPSGTRLVMTETIRLGGPVSRAYAAFHDLPRALLERYAAELATQILRMAQNAEVR